jgi:hypothetical protein
VRLSRLSVDRKSRIGSRLTEAIIRDEMVVSVDFINRRAAAVESFISPKSNYLASLEAFNTPPVHAKTYKTTKLSQNHNHLITLLKDLANSSLSYDSS